MDYIPRLLLTLLCLSLIACSDELKEFKAQSFHKFVEVGVVDADLSKDAKITALLDINQNISIWDNQSHSQLVTFSNTFFNELQYHISLSDNQKYIASAGKKYITIFSIETEKVVASWPVKGFGEDIQITQILLNHAGNKIFIGLNEGSIISVDLKYNKRSIHKIHNTSVTKLMMHHNGQSIFSIGNDGIVAQWHVYSGEVLWSTGFDQRITSFAFDNTNEKVFISDALKSQKIINLTASKSHVSLDYIERFRFFRQAIFLSSGNKLLTASSKYQLSLWDTSTGNEIAFGQVRSYNFGSMILDFSMAINDNVYSISSDGVLEVWHDDNFK